MFKNSKEKNSNYISTEEIEKMYIYQKKSFDAKIAEQQLKIDELTNFISERFGEDVANSNIATKLKNIERSLQDIEAKCKRDLEKTKESFEKQIKKEGEKIAEDLNDAHTESYFKLVQKNEADIEKIYDFFSQKDNKILELNKIVQEHIKNNEIYIKQIEDELEENNQKISKINYLGLSSKFDKKIKEESTKIDDKVEQIKKQIKADFTKQDEILSKKLATAKQNIKNATNVINNIEEKVSKKLMDVSGSVESTATLIGNLDERLSGELVTINEHLENTGNSVIALDKRLLEEISAANEKIDKTENSVKAFDEKLSKGLVAANEQIENSVSSLNERFSKDLMSANEIIQNALTSVNNLDEKLSKEKETTVKNFENKLNKLDKKLLEKFETVNTNIQNAENKTHQLEASLVNKVVAINESMQNNQSEIAILQENTQKDIEQLKQEMKQTIGKIEENLDNKNLKIEEKIKQLKEKLKIIQKETKAIETSVATKLEETKQENNNVYAKFELDINEKIDAKIQEVNSCMENAKSEMIKLEEKTKADSEEIKLELNKQIINNQNENKNELENVLVSIESIKTSLEDSINNVGQEILKLKDETKFNIEKHNCNNDNIELLKKDYNKYVAKMNNELAKISKAIMNVQKKNLEINQNLQLKIKAYIDNKIEKANNTQKIEELVNNLSLSIQEREKIQKLEMEENLNKKLKAIQKENERLLNKRIEEITSKLLRENTTSTKTNQISNNMTIYKEENKKKTNMYELIDKNQILKRGATSKNPLSTAKEGKSQILKFFYDDEE